MIFIRKVRSIEMKYVEKRIIVKGVDEWTPIRVNFSVTGELTKKSKSKEHTSFGKAFP